MVPEQVETRNHYDTLLAGSYAWMAGGYDTAIRRHELFFAAHHIRPLAIGRAVDLGAGCGFASIALGRAGFSVTAVDFSQPMLSELTAHAGTLPVRTVHTDILATERWTGNSPELIVCVGDTLTHLPDPGAVISLIRACARDLNSGGRLAISCRNYSEAAAGTICIIPVRRDEDRIFLCRLEYDTTRIEVTDILYSKESGVWLRHAGTYTKLRIAPEVLLKVLAREGFRILVDESDSESIVLIAERQ